jgi:hypothetical protein
MNYLEILATGDPSWTLQYGVYEVTRRSTTMHYSFEKRLSEGLRRYWNRLSRWASSERFVEMHTRQLCA